MKTTTIKLKHGERVIRLKATRPIKCRECKRQLNIGELFWLELESKRITER